MKPNKISSILCGMWMGSLILVADKLRLSDASRTLVGEASAFAITCSLLLPFASCVLGREALTFQFSPKLSTDWICGAWRVFIRVAFCLLGAGFVLGVCGAAQGLGYIKLLWQPHHAYSNLQVMRLVKKPNRSLESTFLGKPRSAAQLQR